MRIALLSYRSKPHCGGQGVYVRHLSRELAELGHHVEVFSGQPYPELDRGRPAHRGAQPGPVPRARPVPHAAARASSATAIDVLEVGDDVDRRLPRAADLQPAGRPCCCRRGSATSTSSTTTSPSATGLLGIAARGPAAGGHDPPPDHRRPAARPGAAASWRRRLTLRRWYGFLRHAGPGRPAAGPDPDPSASSRRATSSPTSASTRRGIAGHPGRRRHPRVPPAGRQPRVPGRDHDDGQRRRRR